MGPRGARKTQLSRLKSDWDALWCAGCVFGPSLQGLIARGGAKSAPKAPSLALKLACEGSTPLEMGQAQLLSTCTLVVKQAAMVSGCTRQAPKV